MCFSHMMRWFPPKRMSGRLSSVHLVLALLASTMLAGCMDNPFDRDEPTPAVPLEGIPIGAVTDGGPDASEIRARAAREECDGCITLRAPGTLGPTPTRSPATQTFEVPTPNDGDLFLSSREPKLTTTDALAGKTIANGETQTLIRQQPADGLYGAVPGPHHRRDDTAEPKLVPIEARVYSDDATPPNEPFRETAYQVIDRYTRNTLETRSMLSRWDRAAGPVEGIFERNLTREHTTQRPMAEAPFELGAHLWDRTLSPGTAFVVTVEAPRDALPALTFHYQVADVSPDHSTAEVSLIVRDTAHNMAGYTIIMRADSPYPALVQPQWMRPGSGSYANTVDVVDSVGHRLTERGRLELAWPLPEPQVTPGMRTTKAWNGDADIEALDHSELPYLLAHAINDIDHPPMQAPRSDVTPSDPRLRSMLVAARLETTWADDPLIARGQIGWTVTWLLSTGEMESWRTTREFLFMPEDERRPMLFGQHTVTAATNPPFATPIASYQDEPRLAPMFAARTDMLLHEAISQLDPDHGALNRAHFHLHVLPGGGVTADIGLGYDPDPYIRINDMRKHSVTGSYAVLDAITGSVHTTVTYDLER